MQENKPLCIYHGNCADGFGAAWVVRKALGDVEFHAGVHQNPPPDAAGRDVLLVDFSYKRSVVERMAQTARSILILDHHKSAAEDLAMAEAPAASWPAHLAHGRSGGGPCAIHALFDMDRSGATMAWDYFFPDAPRPPLVNHIEDRDLWRFALPHTREIQANVFSYPYDFQVWDRLMSQDVSELVRDGTAISRKHLKDVHELLGVVTRRMVIGGYNVPMANLPYTLTDDAGEALAQGEPFAGCYWDTPAGRVFSLRSTKEGIDVSEVAKRYGGGGHRQAAGFRVSYADLAQFEPCRERLTPPAT